MNRKEIAGKGANVKIIETIKKYMNYKSFIGRIKTLNTGIKRLLLVTGIIFSFLLFPILSDDSFYHYLDFDEDTLAMILVVGLTFVAYWIFVRIVLWIIDGFRK
jgi:hypothetical protein